MNLKLSGVCLRGSQVWLVGLLALPAEPKVLKCGCHQCGSLALS